MGSLSGCSSSIYRGIENSEKASSGFKIYNWKPNYKISAFYNNNIILNIAEGSGRATDKEMSRFFDISTGSINETIAGLDTLLRLGYMEQTAFRHIFQMYESISRQLGGFKKKLS